MVKRRPAAFSGGFPYRDGARRASLPCSNARLLHIAAPGVAPDDPKNAEPFVDGVVFDNYLDTAGIPDPDLMIRTSGELRLSNFLLWQMAYTEFYFTDVAWPDFNKAELVKAIEKYNQRDRRYGGVKEE